MLTVLLVGSLGVAAWLVLWRRSRRTVRALEETVLFADLKGFTTLAEPMDPQVLVRILNGTSNG